MATTDDLFSQFLRKRIYENDAFGIWMHVHRARQNDICHMANVLSINNEYFERALANSKLTSKDGSRIMHSQWSRENKQYYTSSSCYIIEIA